MKTIATTAALTVAALLVSPPPPRHNAVGHASAPPRTSAGTSPRSCTPSAPSNPAGTTKPKPPGSSASGAYQYIDTTWAHWSTSRRPPRHLPPRRPSTARHPRRRRRRQRHSHAQPTRRRHRLHTAHLVLPRRDQRPRPPRHRPPPRRRQHAHPTPIPTTLAPHSRQPKSPTSWLVRRPSIAATGRYPSPASSSNRTPPRSTHPTTTTPPGTTPPNPAPRIYAIRSGTVAHTSTWTGNCYGQTSCADPCGTGVTIADSDGAHWTYCHATQLNVALGDTVTGRSTNQDQRQHRQLQRTPPPPQPPNQRHQPLPPTHPPKPARRHNTRTPTEQSCTY